MTTTYPPTRTVKLVDYIELYQSRSLDAYTLAPRCISLHRLVGSDVASTVVRSFSFVRRPQLDTCVFIRILPIFTRLPRRGDEPESSFPLA